MLSLTFWLCWLLACYQEHKRARTRLDFSGFKELLFWRQLPHLLLCGTSPVRSYYRRVTLLVVNLRIRVHGNCNVLASSIQ
jgi:hypothetical protein